MILTVDDVRDNTCAVTGTLSEDGMTLSIRFALQRNNRLPLGALHMGAFREAVESIAQASKLTPTTRGWNTELASPEPMTDASALLNQICAEATNLYQLRVKTPNTLTISFEFIPTTQG